MSRRDLWALVGVLLALVVLSLAGIGASGDSAGDTRFSTLRSSDPGALALFLLIEELGIPVEQWYEPFDEEIEVPEVTALLGTYLEPLTPGEAHRLLERVREGGRLLFAPASPGPLLDSLGYRRTMLAPASVRGFDRFTWHEGVARPTGHPLMEGVGEVSGWAWALRPDTASRADRMRELRGIRIETPEEEGETDTTRVESVPVEPLLEVDGRLVAGLVRLGEGEIVLWSDVNPLRNAEIDTTGAALPFMRLVHRASRGEPVQIDEYHHGYREGSGIFASTWGYLTGTPPGHGLLHLLGVILLGLAIAGIRFGAPIPLPPVRRRSPLEHVRALAGAYRRGRAVHSARRLLLLGLARRLGRRRPPKDEVEGWIASLPGSAEARARIVRAWGEESRRVEPLAQATDDLLAEVTR